MTPKLSVFPVPATDYIQIVGEETTGINKITAVSIDGKITTLSLFNGIADISNLTPGVYTVMASKENQQFYYRIVKE